MVLARATGNASPQKFATDAGSSHLRSPAILLAVVAGTLSGAYRAMYAPNLARTHELDHFRLLLAGFRVRLLDSRIFCVRHFFSHDTCTHSFDYHTVQVKHRTYTHHSRTVNTHTRTHREHYVQSPPHTVKLHFYVRVLFMRIMRGHSWSDKFVSHYISLV